MYYNKYIKYKNKYSLLLNKLNIDNVNKNNLIIEGGG